MSELTIQRKTNKKAETFKRLALAKSLMQDGRSLVAGGRV